MVLLTSGHVALLACTSKPKDKAVTYNSKWTLRLHDVQNVRGERDSTMQVAIPVGVCYCVESCTRTWGCQAAELLAKPDPS